MPEKKKCTENGFTLIEVMASWLLVLLAILFIFKIIVFSFDGIKKSRIRLEIAQKLETCKNQLLSKPFDSDELEDGHSSTDDGLFRVTRDISSLSLTLKEIKLSIAYKTLNKQIYFYKSMTIKEVKND